MSNLNGYLTTAADGGGFFGSASREEVSNLIKAINAGHADPPAGGSAGAGDPLRVESLEKTLTRLTFADQHCAMWKLIPKEPAYSTVEEYNVLDNYGSERLSAFTSEGELPVADDSQYSRKNVKIKFMGTLRAVSHPMGMVRTAHGDVIAQETVAGSLWLMRQVEKALFFGDSSVIGSEWDGLCRQLVDGSGHVVDLAGAAMSMARLEDAAETVFGQGSFGKLDCLVYGTGAHKEFAQDLFGTANANVRLNADNVMGGPAVPGFSLSRVATVFGDINLKPDVFLSPAAVGSVAASGDSAKRPDAAGVTTANPAHDVGKASTNAWLAAGSGVKYLVVAINASGNAVSSATAAFAPTNAAQSVKVTIDAPAGGTPAPTGYEIYRTKDGEAASGSYYQIDRIARATAASTLWGNESALAAGVTSFWDKNARIAGTGIGLGITHAQNTYGFKQLAPFMKIPLAQIDLRTRWAQILYGAPVLRAPKKVVLFKNIKQG